MAKRRWTAEHFSQSNGRGGKSRKQQSVSALLRRVAKSLDELGDVQVQDVVFHMEIDEDGRDSPMMTVYYHRA